MSTDPMSDEQKRIRIAEALGFERWKANSSGATYLMPPPSDRQRAYWLSCGDHRTDEEPRDATWECIIDPEGAQIYGCGDTLPLAVCDAFLKWLAALPAP